MARSFLACLIAVLFAACSGAQRSTAVSVPEEPSAARGVPAPAGPDKRARVMRLFMEATQARLSGQPAKAISLYQQCLKVDPNIGAAHFELGKLFLQVGDRRMALESAKRAVAADKENIWYRFLLADLHRDAGQIDQSAEVYRAIIAKWPRRHEVYLELAGTLEQAGRDNDALKVYADLEKRTGPNEEVLMRQFGLLTATGRYAEAKKVVERAIAAYPREASYLGLLAELYDEQGEHDKAEETYEQALRLDPGNSMLRGALAEHYFILGRIPEAFDQLRFVFQDPDMDIDAKMRLLLGFFEMSRFEGSKPGDREALIARSYGLIDALQEAHPESPKPCTVRGDFLFRDRRYAEARDEFMRALRHERDHYPIWAQLMDLDLLLGEHQALVEHATEVIELFPLVPDPYLYKGIGLSRLGDHEEAASTLIEGRDLVVDNPLLAAQFWSSLGDVYHEARRYDRSDEAFERALALVPDDPNALNNHAYYLSERNAQLEKAERLSRRSNELAPDEPNYLDTYAWVLFRMGRYEDARTWIEKALAKGGDTQGVIVEHHGDILFKLGDKAGALQQWRKAKELGGASDTVERKITEEVWSE